MQELALTQDTRADARRVCRHAQTWAGFVAMEVRQGNLREARALYKRAYSRTFEGAGQACCRHI